MKKTILVIDDDSGVQRMVQIVLEDAGFNVVSLGSARRGLDEIEKGDRPFDLIITDIIMPEMEGIEFISRIKTQHKDLPVIAISGGGRSHNLDFLTFAEKLGANAVLPKPFRRDQLLDIVNTVLLRGS